jgi:hypothetical protein
MGRNGINFSGSGEGQVAGSCECGNEPSGFIKRGISLLAEDLLASQEGLCSMELVSYDIPFDLEYKIILHHFRGHTYTCFYVICNQ